MNTYPSVQIDNVNVMFLPDNVLRVDASTQDQIRQFEMKLQKGQFLFNPQARYDLPDEQKVEIVFAVEKAVNAWVKDHPVERLDLEAQVVKFEISREQRNIEFKRDYLKTVTVEMERMIENSSKCIEEYKIRLASIENEKLEAMRKLLP